MICDPRFPANHDEFERWLEENNQFLVNRSMIAFGQAYVL